MFSILLLFGIHILSDTVAVLNDIPTTNAEKLAYIFPSSTDNLFLDDESLVNDIDTALNAIYHQYPQIKDDEYYPEINYRFNTLIFRVTNDSTMSLALSEGEYIANNNISTFNLTTGIIEFDAINYNASLQSIHTASPDPWRDDADEIRYILRYSNSWINLNKLISQYSKLKELKHSYIWKSYYGFYGGKPRDIFIETALNYKDCGCWYIIFYKGWGDCPAGCGYRENRTCTIFPNIKHVDCDFNEHQISWDIAVGGGILFGWLLLIAIILITENKKKTKQDEKRIHDSHHIEAIINLSKEISEEGTNSKQ